MDNQDGVSGVVNHAFGDIAQDPATDTRPPVGVDGDEVVGRFACQVNDLSCRLRLTGTGREQTK